MTRRAQRREQAALGAVYLTRKGQWGVRLADGWRAIGWGMIGLWRRSQRSGAWPWLAAFACAMLAHPASAHTYEERYELPLPLWLHVTGAASVVVVSFIIAALFYRKDWGTRDYPRMRLLRSSIGRLLAHPLILGVVRVVSVFAFGIILAAAAFGSQNPFVNIAPLFVWAFWWVGLAYVCALVGNVWELINPWKITFAWAERLYGRLRPGRSLSFNRRYPAALGVWPAAVLFLIFSWSEIVWSGAGVPRNIAILASIYTVVTWLGMVVFGKETWLRHGEAFSVFAGLLARFAPTEVRVTDAGACADDAGERRQGACVNCYGCFEQAPPSAREFNLRPYGVGLLPERPLNLSNMVFVLLVLSTVTFDGFRETPPWIDFLGSLYKLQMKSPLVVPALMTMGLIGLPILFFIVFYLTSWLMRVTARQGGWVAATPYGSAAALAGLFALTLVPIAIAYHVAHYFSFFLVALKMLPPILNDPFGFGWEVFGSMRRTYGGEIVTVQFVWIVSVAAIVLGHVVAVVISHAMALRVFGSRRAALYSQYPMMLLMVGYTMLSLWILAQPIVKPTF